MHEAGKLNESKLRAMATEGKFDETTIALSILCDLPIGSIERTLVKDGSEQVVILAKSIGLSWDTTKAILLVKAGTRASSTYEINQCFEQFSEPQAPTAKKVLQFYRLRKRATATS